jgi:hypothetical protein
MKAPGFISDLYSDLRNRKLVPLVVVLVLATIAVPVLLKNDVEAPPPAAAAAMPVEGVPPAAVLVSDPGLRDYRERLDQLRSKDPFAGPEPKAPDLSDAAVHDVSADSGGSTAVTVAGRGGSSSGTSSSPISPASTSTSSSTQTDDVSDSGSGGSHHPEIVELYGRIDVKVGPAGDVERRKDVKLTTVLPSQSNPVLLFVGITEDARHATFIVSEDVVTVHGDGKCLPSPADCQILDLKRDDEMKLGYAPNGEPDTFVIRVLDIGFGRSDESADVSGREATHDHRDALAGLRSFLGS